VYIRGQTRVAIGLEFDAFVSFFSSCENDSSLAVRNARVAQTPNLLRGRDFAGSAAEATDDGSFLRRQSTCVQSWKLIVGLTFSASLHGARLARLRTEHSCITTMLYHVCTAFSMQCLAMSHPNAVSFPPINPATDWTLACRHSASPSFVQPGSGRPHA